MTPEKRKQRLEVIKDVIKQFRAGQYDAQSGVYLCARLGTHEPSYTEFQTVLLKQKPICKVCAIGALFVSEIRLRDALKLSELTQNFGNWGAQRSVMQARLQKLFSSSELSRIEAAFEGWGYKTGKFRHKYPRDRERLLKIMRFMVENKGNVFKSI